MCPEATDTYEVSSGMECDDGYNTNAEDTDTDASQSTIVHGCTSVERDNGYNANVEHTNSV